MKSSDLLWTSTSFGTRCFSNAPFGSPGWVVDPVLRPRCQTLHLTLGILVFDGFNWMIGLQTDISTSCRWSVEDKLPFKAASSVDRLDTLYISCSDILLEHCLNICAAFLLHVVSATHRKRAFIRNPDVPQNWEFHHLLEQIDFFPMWAVRFMAHPVPVGICWKPSK